jgi:hypothetical protein
MQHCFVQRRLEMMGTSIQGDSFVLTVRHGTVSYHRGVTEGQMAARETQQQTRPSEPGGGRNVLNVHVRTHAPSQDP